MCFAFAGIVFGPWAQFFSEFNVRMRFFVKDCVRSHLKTSGSPNSDFLNEEDTKVLLNLGHPGGSWYTANRDHALALATKKYGKTKKNHEFPGNFREISRNIFREGISY